MQVIRNWDDIPYISNGIATIGFFDGFHIGHRTIINRMLSEARHQGGETVVFTFYNHPLQVLFPQRAPKLLSPISYKEEYLAEQGVDYLVIPDFTRDFSTIRAGKFLAKLREQFGKLRLLVGSNFRFGYKNEGCIAFMENYAASQEGFDLEAIEPICRGNHIISSSLLRSWVGQGKVKEVSSLLERDFYIENEIVQGDKRGRTIGFPTANVPIPDFQVVPKFGVYLGSACIKNKTYRALIYVGRQKVDKTLARPLVEAHLLDFDQDVYGEEIRINFSSWLREPCKVQNVDELKKLLTGDALKFL